MKTCPSCQKPIANNAISCPNCGQQNPPSVGKIVIIIIFCALLGALIALS